MDAKIFRSLIYLFVGLIVIFSLLILVNYLGSLTGASSEVPGQRDGGEPVQSASSMARQALAAAKFGGAAVPRASMIPAGRQGLSTAAVTSEGAIRVVKDKRFNGVAEKPKSMMDMLNDMGGGKKGKPSPVRLQDSDLDKRVRQLGGPGNEASLKTASMPEMGRGAAQEGVTLLNAPADYKLFKSSETWWAFANSHKCRADSLETGSGSRPLTFSTISAPDFSHEYVLVLISVSDLPNGILRITGLGKNGKDLVVSYRVDPLAIAAGDVEARHDFYSAAVIPRTAAVKLSQKP